MISVDVKFTENIVAKEILVGGTKKKLREFLSQKELTVCHLRCKIVGCTGAGKTTLLRRLGNLTFENLNSVESTEIDDVQSK